jgi:cytochrome c peroxidase
MVQLGLALFHDKNLSNPPGQSCASCHSAPEAFTFPDAVTNASSGIAPGAVPGRFGNRLPPSVTYAKFSPPGPYYDPNLTAYAGGQFWDGRVINLTQQAQKPFFNPNEMDDIVHNVADSGLLAQKIQSGANAQLFEKVFGANAFNDSPQVNLSRVGQAIAAFESIKAVSPFSSKYDDYLTGRTKLSQSEMNGLRLFTGSATGRPGGPANYKSAQCVLCHGIPTDPSTGPDIFSNFCYANIGTPRNLHNPFYYQTNQATDPLGYNPQGINFVDLGLGDFLYPAAGLPPGNAGKGNNGQGDYLAINGTFKAPSLRNVDKRPYPSFPRRYMHNGAFTSLKQIVHFYNTRNLTTKPREVIDFTQPDPYAGLIGKPLWPPPEYPSSVTLQNASGQPGSANAQVGNLGLTPQEEDDLVSFLKTLTDR